MICASNAPVDGRSWPKVLFLRLSSGVRKGSFSGFLFQADLDMLHQCFPSVRKHARGCVC